MKLITLGLASGIDARHLATLVTNSQVAVYDNRPHPIHAPPFPEPRTITKERTDYLPNHLLICASNWSEAPDFKKQRGKHRGRNSGAFGRSKSR